MDLKDFNLLYTKESPLFNSEQLGDIVKNVLLEEKVPHSRTSFPARQHVSNTTHMKQRTADSRRDTLISTDSALQNCFIVNTCSSQKCINKTHLSSESAVNSASTDNAKLNSSSPPSAIAFYPNISEHSQSFAHAPQLDSAHAQKTHLSRVSQSRHLHVQSMENNTDISKSSGFSENALLPDAKYLVRQSADDSTRENAIDKTWESADKSIRENAIDNTREGADDSMWKNALDNTCESADKSIRENAIHNTWESANDSMRDNAIDKTLKSADDSMRENAFDNTLESVDDSMRENAIDKTLESTNDSMRENAFDNTLESVDDSMRENAIDKTSENTKDILRKATIQTSVKEGQFSSTNTHKSHHVNKSSHFLASGLLNEISCNCNEVFFLQKTGNTTDNIASTDSRSILDGINTAFTSQTRDMCLQTTSPDVEGPELKYPREDSRRENNLMEMEATSKTDVGCKTETAEERPEVITPAEIGKIDKTELEAMIRALVKANQNFTEFPRQNEPEKHALIQEQNKYLEIRKASPCVNRAEEKESIRSQVLRHSVEYIEMRIIESVRFAKLVPGFLQLPLEDQANLIRESRTESGIVGGMRGINADKQVFSSKQGTFFSLEDMKLVFDENLLKEKILLSKKIASLRMSLEEEAILRAMTITATDRCPLQRKDIVEDIQNKLLSCLMYVVSAKDQEPVARRLGKLFDVLMCCRNVTEVDMKQVKKILLEWPSFSSYKLAGEFL